MCGIIGKIYFDRNSNVEIDELERMTNSIIHRGPDDVGHFIDNNVGLGFRRLSIIDLKSGHQPLCDNSERFWITFNGEIYNFQELRTELQKKGYFFRTKTDTEVIVNLYAEYKEKCVDYLRGMFAFVIWDKQEKELFGVRDRLGIKPFHYYIDNEKFVWASEIKSILTSTNIKKNISLEALDYYFAYGYSQRDQSVFQEIKKLKPAHYFILKPFEKGKITVKSYWEINFTPDYSKNESYWKEAIYNTLNEAVKMRMISDVPLGAFLSGGIDSSTVVALMAINSYKPIKTFSIGFKEEKYSELKYARQVSELYNTDHHEFIVEPESIDLLPKLVQTFDEPFADSSAIPTYYVSKFARKYVTVVLSGDGGDELFVGYMHYLKLLRIYQFPLNNHIFNYLFQFLYRIYPEKIWGKGSTFYLSKNKEYLGAYKNIWKHQERERLYRDDLNKILKNKAAENKLESMIINMKTNDYLSKLQELDMRTLLIDDFLTKVDRASMLNSLEVRIPFLDHKLAELSFKIPSSFKIKGNQKKYILKQTIKNIIPDAIINHKKQGFSVPLKYWFKDDLNEYIHDKLLSSHNCAEVYFNRKSIKRLLKNHMTGMRDFSSQIWSLLIFYEWHEQHK